jgi:nucleoside-diphosphate-sugar epimerase
MDVYNIVDQQSYSVRELAAMIAKQLGVEWHDRSLPLQIARAMAIFGDIVSRTTGKDFPLTGTRLKALLKATHFACGKLLTARFVIRKH